jgi:hypothetical protein
MVRTGTAGGGCVGERPGYARNWLSRSSITSWGM